MNGLVPRWYWFEMGGRMVGDRYRSSGQAREDAPFIGVGKRTKSGAIRIKPEYTLKSEPIPEEYRR